MTQFEPYAWFIVFLISVVICWYVPGRLIIKKLNIKSVIYNILFSLVLGMIIWGAQGIVSGYLNFRWLTYGYVGFNLLLLNMHKKLFVEEITQALRLAFNLPKTIIIGILLVCLSQLSAIFGSGWRLKDGIYFFFVNSVDSVMHLSFIQSMVRQLPPEQPGAVGFPLTNYHYWSDLVMAELVRIWHIPTSHLFFHYIPIYLSILTAIAGYLVIRNIGGSRKAGLWGLFIMAFAADAAYLVHLVFHQSFGFHVSAIDTGPAQFLNMPHAFAKLIFFTGLIPFIWWIKSQVLKWGLLSIIMFGFMIGFKVYFALFVALGLSFILLFRFTKLTMHALRSNKSFIKSLILFINKEWQLVFLYALLGILTLAIFLPVNKSSGGLFYSPLEWPKLFLGADNLDILIWWLRKQLYEANNNIPALWILDTFAIVVTLISIHGVRLIGLIPSLKIYKKIGWDLVYFFIPTSLVFIILGLFTLQVSGTFNVFNFFIITVMVSLILTPLYLESFIFNWKGKPITNYLLFLFILLSVPRSIYQITSYMSDYYLQDNAFVVNNDQYDAMKFIADNMPIDSVVQSHINNDQDRRTPYVSFFTNRSSYLSGAPLLEGHNHPVEERKVQLGQLYASNNPKEVFEMAKTMGITHFYWQKEEVKPDFLNKLANSIGFQIIFENDAAVVVSVVD